MSYYLLEIGCEELPTRFISDSIKFLNTFIPQNLKEMRVPESFECSATARRIFVYIDNLPERQADREESVQGPPAKAAFNLDGTLTETGLKFAKAKSLNEKSIKKVSTSKGEYLSGVRRIPGESACKLMAEFAVRLINSLPAAKTMRWGSGSFRFTRPITYILSLFDTEILPLDIPGIEFTDTTVGHRFLAPQKTLVKDLKSYKAALEKGFVTLFMNERMELIKKQIQALEDGFTVDTEDLELLETAANLTEYPTAVLGSFEEVFLEIPAPVLITSMKRHQKFFPVYDRAGKLTNKFVGISNMQPKSLDLIRSGYERVLGARLADAAFFFKTDKETPLSIRKEMLNKVVYQEKLGSIYDKVLRFKAIGEYLWGKLYREKLYVLQEAAELSKTDLMSEMIYEFPELQGYMGRIYALHQGYCDETALAIEEHYMPRFAGDSLPVSPVGRVLAISDKLDSIAGCFVIGSVPTGSADPYGLRRAAIGIINIIEDAGYIVPIGELVSVAVKNLNRDTKAGVEKYIIEFILQRQKQLVLQNGVSADAFDAACSVATDIIDIRRRAEALHKAKNSEAFLSISAGYKRINNILKKAEFAKSAIDTSIFEYPEERRLFELFEKAAALVRHFAENREWDKAVVALEPFAETLNAFFEKVMVMDEDEKKRTNRLSMLSELKMLFNSVGDLSLL